MASPKKDSGKRKYSGVLKKPMEPAIPLERFESLFSISDDEVQNGLAKNLPAFLERVVALCEHYRIDIKDDDAGWRLALSLARDHVPGFKTIDVDSIASHAPTKWTNSKRVALWLTFRAFQEHGITTERAANEIFENKKLCACFPNISSPTVLIRQLWASGPKNFGLTSLLKTMLVTAKEPAFELACAYVPALKDHLENYKK